MEQLFRALPAVLRDLGPNAQADEAIVIAAWKRCAGEMLNARTQPLEFFEGRLVIAVEDQTWRGQLEAMSPQMVARLNSILGDGTVSFIEFRIEASAIQRHWRSKLEPGAIGDVEPSIGAAAGAISDEGLRKRFLETAASILNKS
jgi:hypothetical protein